MKGNYKVRVRVPIYATVVIDQAVIGADSEAEAIAEAQETTDELDIGIWFQKQWKPPTRPIPSLAEVIEFEATETEPTEGK